jgi:CheY-like chemotaxis protein
MPRPTIALLSQENADLRRRLAEAEEALRAADTRKDEFLAVLAHELRNPLAPIRNALQVVSAKGAADPDTEWAWNVVSRQALLMARLLDDLLDASRMALNRVELRIAPVELAAVCEAAIEISRPLIEAGRHELEVSLPAQPVALAADALRLTQVLANLLNNAARYTEDGGRIRLSVELQGNEVRIAVKDNGIGISPELLPRVFEPLSRARGVTGRSHAGLGIGLSLVKGLVELHGGSVEAHSDGPGSGSEFTIRLRVATGLSASEPARAGDDDAPALANRRILIVDDNRDGTESLAMLLELMGHLAETAYDGEHALEIAETTRPEVVLLDLGMPGLSGYDVCRRIRARPWGRDVVLIALTGWGQEADRRRTKEAGFDHHMVKPVDPAFLKRVLTGDRE